jgi:hypothetical protein
MMENFLDKLTEEQSQIALEIARKAKEMGVDPRLAIALAYRESGLNPQAKGGKGEVGLMQVMPATAKGLGFTPEELADPSKNIEIGLTYLKRGLEKFGGDPVLAAAGYNAGLDHPYFSDPDNKPLPASTKEYLKGINGLGGFTASTPKEEDTPQQVEAPASEGDFQANKARIAADLIGAGAGAGIAKGLDITKNIGDTAAAIRQLPAAMAPPSAPTAPTAASAGPAAPGMARPVAGGPAGPVGGPASPLQQMGGSATANYGKAFGLTDIEANRATDMSKQPGGASDLINKRTQALQKIQQMGGGYVENPRYGGIMTPEAGVGGGPRASYVQSPGGLSQLPPPQAVPNAPIPPQAPPQPGALAKMGQGLQQGAGAVLRSPVAMGALGGLSAMEGAQESQKRYSEGDMPGAAIAGAGVIGGGMQMIPSVPTKAVGAMISAASPLTLYLYDKLRGQGAREPQEPTERELMEASRPAFGIYPKPMRQPPLRPRTFAPGENLPPVEFLR